MTERDLPRTFTVSQLPFAPRVPIIRTEGLGMQQKGYRVVVPWDGILIWKGITVIFLG